MEKKTEHHYDETNDEDSSHYLDEGRKVTNLKLEAQKIRDFSGLNMNWTKWKNRTECAFDGSGYGRILTDSEFAQNIQ